MAVAVGLVAVMASTASAQWHATAIGVAEVDTKETLLLLGGLSASPGGKGISPSIGLQAYHIGYDGGTSRTNVFTVKPYAGLANNYDGGSVHANLGYAFSNKSGISGLNVSGADAGEGVVLAGGWDQWGTGSPWGQQILGSYNFGSESFWGRGRLSKRITPSGASQRRLGGEVAYLNGKGYSAVQPGAVLEFHNGRGSILGVGAGMKFFGNSGGNAVYFKVEGVVPVAR